MTLAVAIPTPVGGGDQAVARALVRALPRARVTVWTDDEPSVIATVVARQCRCSSIVMVRAHLPANTSRTLDARRSRDAAIFESVDVVFVLGALAPDRAAVLEEIRRSAPFPPHLAVRMPDGNWILETGRRPDELDAFDVAMEVTGRLENASTDDDGDEDGAATAE